jgi:hypothetical protein
MRHTATIRAQRRVDDLVGPIALGADENGPEMHRTTAVESVDGPHHHRRRAAQEAAEATLLPRFTGPDDAVRKPRRRALRQLRPDGPVEIVSSARDWPISFGRRMVPPSMSGTPQRRQNTNGSHPLLA